LLNRAEDRIAGCEPKSKVADIGQGFPVDSELAQHSARYLGKADTQIDLVGRSDLKVADDLLAGTDEAAGEAPSVFRFGRGGDRAGQHYGAVHRLGRDLALRHHLVQPFGQPHQVMSDDHIEVSDDSLFLVDREKRRLPRLLCEYVDQPRRFHRHLGHIWIGDEDCRRRPIDAHQGAFIDFDRHRLSRSPDQLGARSRRTRNGTERKRGKRNQQPVTQAIHCPPPRLTSSALPP
jgi:hypothetical protein